MKYIRTENYIYEVINKEETNDSCMFVRAESKCGLPFSLLDKEDIIKQADTIEELCDEFVVVDKRHNVHYLMDYDDLFDELYGGRLYDEDINYGAIWTSKGLIYVAKLNDKGDLELI